MKVVVLTTSFPRWEGDLFGSFVFGLSRALVRASVHVDVVCPHDQGTVNEDVVWGIHVHRFNYMFPGRWQSLCYGAGIPANIGERPARLFQVPFLIAGFIRAGAALVRHCDIIHAHWTLAGLAAEILGRLYQRPIVLHMHGAEVYTRQVAPLIKPVVNWADHVVCNSSFTEKAVCRFANPKATTVIPFGVNEERILLDGAGSSYLRQHLGLTEETRIVSFLGRLISRKGVDDLIRAAQLLVEQGYLLHLVIGGTGPQRVQWEGLVKGLGICDHVTFLGFVPDDKVAHFFAGSDVFVLPAVIDKSGDTEGLGMVLLEAMANGVPVVATEVGGISDVVVDGETGFLVDQRNPVQLAEKIALLCQNPSLRTSMGLAARERVRRFFSWPSVVERTLQVYNSVLARRESA